MVQQYKIDMVKEISDTLEGSANFILTSYSGIKVADLTRLRRNIRAKGGKLKVVKNNLFNRALTSKGYTSLDEQLKGPIAVAFGGDQIGDIAQVLKEFKKEHESFSYFLGVIDKSTYDEKSIQRIADLPSKEVLFAQIMSGLNSPARVIASGMNQIMSSLARGIKAVAEKNNLA